MFSKDQKIKIAQEVEKILLSFDHPEMPKNEPNFTLKVEGKGVWSWAEIKPNWIYDRTNRKRSINPFNERNAIKR